MHCTKFRNDLQFLILVKRRGERERKEEREKKNHREKNGRKTNSHRKGDK